MTAKPNPSVVRLYRPTGSTELAQRPSDASREYMSARFGVDRALMYSGGVASGTSRCAEVAARGAVGVAVARARKASGLTQVGMGDGHRALASANAVVPCDVVAVR